MELIVQKREKFGKQTKSLRKAGLIPAELYGRGIPNLHLSVPSKDFKKVFKAAGESAVVNVLIDGKRHPAMIHDIAHDPITDEILNVDFYEVRLDERIKVKVPLNFKGEAPAVKEGGVLIKAMQEVEVEALPGNIPHGLDVNLDKLDKIGVSLYVKDLSAGAEVKILVNPETVIATVKEKAAEEPAAVAPEVTVESVKVETEEKKAEREQKKTGEGTETKGTEETKPKAEK